jgi:hypothetical protein
MSRSVKIVGGLAAAGFFLPLVMLAYYAVSRNPAGNGFVHACPPCIISLALDGASIFTGIIAWFIICLSNAAIYALPGLGIAFLLNLRKSN